MHQGFARCIIYTMIRSELLIGVDQAVIELLCVCKHVKRQQNKKIKTSNVITFIETKSLIKYIICIAATTQIKSYLGVYVF